MTNSGASAAPLPTDPCLPGLASAGDPEVMLAYFQEHLRPAGSETREILACRLSRVRYRRAERCILQYALRFPDPVAGSERELSVSGTIYAEAGKAERIWRKLRTPAPVWVPTGAAPAFESVSFIPALGMLVQVFPYDRRLSGLRRLAAGPPSTLEPDLLSRFGPGDWHADSWEVESVRYREQLGAVLRYKARARDLRTGRRAEKRFYVKVYRDESGERTLKVLQDLGHIGRAGASFDVGRPVTYLNGLKALVLEEAPGITLEQALLRNQDPAGAAHEAARALAAFNQIEMHTPRQHRLRDQVAGLKRAGRILSWACPHLAPEVEDLIGNIAANLEEAPLRPTHRDLKPDHVFLEDGCVTFVDLDSFARADPVLDPASLLARLSAMPYLFPIPRRRVFVSARAFAEEYFDCVPAAWRGRLRPHYAASILEVAHGFFRRQEPDWPDKVAALVDEAKRSMDGQELMMGNLVEASRTTVEESGLPGAEHRAENIVG